MLRVEETHHVALAAAEARRVAAAAGLDETEACAVAIAVSELAGNVVRHARAPGTVELRPLADGDRRGVEVVVEDHGVGIADVAAALRDDFSTAGGLGSGLPAVRRLMDEFELESRPGQGTRAKAAKWHR
jgi:serine/threonine-protein kinase RsbT